MLHAYTHGAVHWRAALVGVVAAAAVTLADHGHGATTAADPAQPLEVVFQACPRLARPSAAADANATTHAWVAGADGSVRPAGNSGRCLTAVHGLAVTEPCTAAGTLTNQKWQWHDGSNATAPLHWLLELLPATSPPQCLHTRLGGGQSKAGTLACTTHVSHGDRQQVDAAAAYTPAGGPIQLADQRNALCLVETATVAPPPSPGPQPRPSPRPPGPAPSPPGPTRDPPAEWAAAIAQNDKLWVFNESAVPTLGRYHESLLPLLGNGMVGWQIGDANMCGSGLAP